MVSLVFTFTTKTMSRKIIFRLAMLLTNLQVIVEGKISWQIWFSNKGYTKDTA